MRSRQLIFSAIVLAIFLLFSAKLIAHCQIPCGIYEDEMRYDMLSEDILTIKTSMENISRLSSEKIIDYNQLVRWINNKEDHANKIIDIVSQYFLIQRIKPAEANKKDNYKKYVKHLKVFHSMLINAMKCKQTTDISYTKKLEKLVSESRKLYFK